MIRNYRDTSEEILSSYKVKKMCVDFLNFFLSLVWKIILKEFKGHSRALLSVTDARGKKMQTPSKQPESSNMTHEEEEKMLHDISK